MATVLYDCTRLIARRNAVTPTGIDRVDLQYALHILSTYRENAAFVTQHGGKLHLVPLELAGVLLSQLDEKWFRSIGTTPQIDLTEELKKLGALDAEGKTKHSPLKKEPVRPSAKPVPKPTGVTAEDIAEMRDLSIKDRWALLHRVKLTAHLPANLKWFASAPRLFQEIVFGAIATCPSLLSPIKSRDRIADSVIDHAPAASAETKPLSASGDGAYSSSKIDEPLAVFLANRHEGAVCYLNMSHHGLLDSDLFIELRTAYGAKFIVYLHDIIPIEYPEYCRPGSKADHVRRLDNVNKVDAFLIFNSTDTSDRVNKYFEKTFGRRPRSIISYIGADNIKRSISGKQTVFKEPYFVIVGTIEGRKNHLGLLQVWREMASQADAVPKLVIIGKRGWNNGAVLEMLDLCEAIRPHVLELNDLADDELFQIVSSARAMLFPSFSEGWGMPLVEALALGVPVICSDIPVFREASQGLAQYIHPLDLKGWESVILEYAREGSQVRSEALERLHAYRLPTWRDMLEQLDEVLGDFGRSTKIPISRERSYTADRPLESAAYASAENSSSQPLSLYDDKLSPPCRST